MLDLGDLEFLYCVNVSHLEIEYANDSTLEGVRSGSNVEEIPSFMHICRVVRQHQRLGDYMYAMR